MAVFLFPGQGSQAVGMGKDLYQAFPQVRELYDQAAEFLGFDLRQYSFEGPEEELKKTEVTQPALFVHSVALNGLLAERGMAPEATAGHSLGEFSAVVSAGALDFLSALAVVKVRAEEMAKAGELTTGAMAAIMGANPDQITMLCDQAGAAGVVVPANLNAPGQVVLSGDAAAIDEAVKIAGELGIRRAIRLNVSGAFHSPLMTPAREALAQALDAVQFSDPHVPVYQNASAKAVNSAAEIKANLLLQLENTVNWEASIRQFQADGFKSFVEVGVGKVLQGLNRRIVPDAQTTGVGSLEDMETLNV